MVAFPRHRRTSPHRLCTCTRTARPQRTAKHLRQVPHNDRHRAIIGSVPPHSWFGTCHVERASGVETFPSHNQRLRIICAPPVAPRGPNARPKISNSPPDDVRHGAFMRSVLSHSCVRSRRVDCAIDAVAFPRHRRTSPHRLRTCTRSAQPQCTAKHLPRVHCDVRHGAIIGSVRPHRGSQQVPSSAQTVRRGSPVTTEHLHIVCARVLGQHGRNARQNTSKPRMFPLFGTFTAPRCKDVSKM